MGNSFLGGDFGVGFLSYVIHLNHHHRCCHHCFITIRINRREKIAEDFPLCGLTPAPFILLLLRLLFLNQVDQNFPFPSPFLIFRMRILNQLTRLLNPCEEKIVLPHCHGLNILHHDSNQISMSYGHHQNPLLVRISPSILFSLFSLCHYFHPSCINLVSTTPLRISLHQV